MSSSRSRLSTLVIIPAVLAGAGLAIYAVRRSRRKTDDPEGDTAQPRSDHVRRASDISFSPPFDVNAPLLHTTYPSYGTQDSASEEREDSGPSQVDSVFDHDHDRSTSSTSTAPSAPDSPVAQKLARSPELPQRERQHSEPTFKEVYSRSEPAAGKVSVASLRVSADKRTVIGKVDAEGRVFGRWTKDKWASFTDTDADDQGELRIDIGDAAKAFAMAVCAVDAEGEHWDSNHGANYHL